MALNKDYTNAKANIQDIDEMISGEDVPHYSDAVAQIQKLYEGIRKNLNSIATYLAADGLKIENLPEQYKTKFADSPKRYKELTDAITTQLNQFTNLPKLELEQIYDQLKQKNARTIIVQVDNKPKSKVLTYDTVFPMSQKQTGDPGKIQYDFNGETAISSAIMALTAKEKSAVIFVHAGPPDPVKPNFNQMRMSQAPYNAAKEKLEEANFVVESWDLLQNPEPPTVPDVTRKIFVVVPSMPQRGQQGMPPMGGYDQPQIDRIGKLIDKGEKVMFLVNFQPTIMGKPYPFTQLIEQKYGVKIDADKLVLQGVKMRDRTFPNNQISISRYDDHEITRPIQSLNTTFLWAVPMSPIAKLPEGVKVTPLVSIKPGAGDFWGETDIITLLQRQWAEKDKNDLPMPFDLAVAVENAKTKAKSVIFGNELFVTDNVANQVQYVMTGQGIGAIYVCPGNLEIFTNSAFWLNDNENLISVGPRRADVARIGDISDGGQLGWKIFLWVFWPMGALVSGGIVYLFRRK